MVNSEVSELPSSRNSFFLQKYYLIEIIQQRTLDPPLSVSILRVHRAD
jgi:hypothetical protein